MKINIAVISIGGNYEIQKQDADDQMGRSWPRHSNRHIQIVLRRTSKQVHWDHKVTGGSTFVSCPNGDPRSNRKQATCGPDIRQKLFEWRWVSPESCHFTSALSLSWQASMTLTWRRRSGSGFRMLPASRLEKTSWRVWKMESCSASKGAFSSCSYAKTFWFLWLFLTHL